MTRKRHTEEQIIAVLKDARAGVSVSDLCRKHGISDACSIVESFNGKFRSECLSEHWFLSLQEAQVVIKAWHREY